MNKINIRFANKNDVPSILNIYTPYILNTPITFEYTAPSISEFEKRITNIQKKYPYLVCEYNNEIIGYAYASEYKGREAYAYTAELSIYIKKEFKNAHIGRNLYLALIDILKMQNFQILYACITIHKTLYSNVFHKKLGFEEIGYFKKSGFKDNHWYDTAWYCLEIGDFSIPPKAIKTVNQLNMKNVEKILKKYTLKINNNEKKSTE
ncbi:GNAT family N-acetyltransferase [Anaerofustis sp.]|uniref:GNAT family N-acetyltransferase n=1 Tax=Anaerofustis sp. TaxID=1872517 RepID=UPI0025C34982|nr:GNAT family N-acetyltransferase [Anaerofustis sp.]